MPGLELMNASLASVANVFDDELEEHRRCDGTSVADVDVVNPPNGAGAFTACG